MTPDQTLQNARFELISALFINFKIEENTILRSTYDEILKPLQLKELKTFMLLLSQTNRNYRSTLELVSDVVAQTVRKRIDQNQLREKTELLEKKFQAIMSLASIAIQKSDYATELDFLAQAEIEKFTSSDKKPLFLPDELELIQEIGFMTLVRLSIDDVFLFQQRVMNYLTASITGNALRIASTGSSPTPDIQLLNYE